METSLSAEYPCSMIFYSALEYLDDPDDHVSRISGSVDRCIEVIEEVKQFYKQVFISIASFVLFNCLY